MRSLKQDYVFANDNRIQEYPTITKGRIRIPKFAYEEALTAIPRLKEISRLFSSARSLPSLSEHNSYNNSRTAFFIGEEDYGFIGLRGTECRQMRVMADVLNLPREDLPGMTLCENVPIAERKWLYQCYINATREPTFYRFLDRALQLAENIGEASAQTAKQIITEFRNKEFTQP